MALALELGGGWRLEREQRREARGAERKWLLKTKEERAIFGIWWQNCSNLEDRNVLSKFIGSG